MTNLLLLSNSTNHGQGYLDHARDILAEVLSDISELIFIPYALADYDGYTAKVSAALEPLGVTVRGLHREGDSIAAVGEAAAIFTGGGNTFRLLKTLYQQELLDPIRARVESGMPYLGASAGTNIAGPTIRTTNDMPIVEPPSLTALGLIGFQINPHYVDPDPASTHMGETRETRIGEFLECNDVPVLGLREGCWLRVAEDTTLVAGRATNGRQPARLFRPGTAAKDVSGDVSQLVAVADPVWG